MSIQALLEGLGACDEARVWAGDRTLRQVWDECGRGDWLLWLGYRLRVDPKLMALATCDCVRPALVHCEHIPEARAAIAAVEAWTRGEGSASKEQHIEYAFVMTREQAYQRGLLDKATHGDSSARVDVRALPPETEVEVWGGMIERHKLAAYLRKVLVLLEGAEGERA